MRIIILNIIVAALCLIPVLFGFVFIVSGIRVRKGKSPLVRGRESVWDRLFYEYYLYRWLLGDSKNSKENGIEQIFSGILLILLGLGFYLFLAINGFVF